MIKILLILTMFGCVGTRTWTSQQHQDMMLMCKKMCNGDRAASYEPFTGDCTCG